MVMTLVVPLQPQLVLENVEKPREIKFKGTADLVTNTDLASEEAILKVRGVWVAELSSRLSQHSLPSHNNTKKCSGTSFRRLEGVPFPPPASSGECNPTAPPCTVPHAMQVVQEAFPNHAILGEEGGVKGDTSSDYLWCIDPLDGTTNFAHGYPSFAVSVAVLRHTLPVAACVVEFTGERCGPAGGLGGWEVGGAAAAQQAVSCFWSKRRTASKLAPISACLATPLLAGGPGSWITRTYAASRNGGATCNGKPISVSRTHELEKSLMVRTQDQQVLSAAPLPACCPH